MVYFQNSEAKNSVLDDGDVKTDNNAIDRQH